MGGCGVNCGGEGITKDEAMSRKSIPDSVQTNILLKSRRRCCICFWLEGHDEVKKGQIAHLDQNHENPEEENLVFLCLEHHDEYDGRTSVSKGLKESEVRRWRDELYREMEYRFRTTKRQGFDVSFVGILWRGRKDSVGARFRLKNAGDGTVRHPTVSICLLPGIEAKLPKRLVSEREDDVYGIRAIADDFDMWGMSESIQDFFVVGGRVGMVDVVGGPNPQLLSGHTSEFDGLSIPLDTYRPGNSFELDYRVDSSDTQPVYGKVKVEMPTDHKSVIVDL